MSDDSDDEPNEVAAVLGVRSMFAPGTIDCGTFLAVEVGETGAYLDFCAVCSRRESEHDDDDVVDDDE
jgi:hypothetical protein